MISGPTKSLAAIGLLISAVCLMATGCRSLSSSAVVLEVPFAKQEGAYCGSDALYMVLKYHGADVNRDVVRERVHIPVLKGTTPGMIAHRADQMGYDVEFVTGSPEELTEWIEQGVPPILFVSEGEELEIGHFLVVTGIDPVGNTAVVHSGRRRDQRLDLSKLLDDWKRGRYSSVIVTGRKGIQ